jgi:uncharacterized SAM-binding protein YcdF (DUF218 family)
VMGTPLVYWWTEALRGAWSDGRGETLVVLAAELLTEESGAQPATIGEGTYLRCVYAAWAWRENHYPHIIVSGNRGAAAAMGANLAALGVPGSAIELEPQAESTRENALRVKERLAGRGGAVVLLSSDYHMRRATSAFERAGVPVKPLPFPDIAKRANGSRFWRWEALRILVEETARLVYYRIRGWA